MRIVCIGAGRVASSLVPALYAAGHVILQVYSRTLTSARSLAERVGAKATDTLDDIERDADVLLFSVTDSVLPSLIGALRTGREEVVFLHTAGSISIDVFGHHPHHGVFYPMQTFTKGRQVDFRKVSFFIEASDDHTMKVERELASALSEHIFELSSSERRYLHLAAVFACNFANHSYALAARILQEHGIPFSVMLPLVDETTEKVHHLSPKEAQTGPAVRNDENVMTAQKLLLSDDPLTAEIYELMSKSIIKNKA